MTGITREEIEKESERVAALRMQMLEMHPFWGYMLLQVRLVPALELPAYAATDCIRHIWFNPAMTRKLTVPELGFVLAHEVCHQVFASMERQGKRNEVIWNMATDYAINAVVAAISIPGSYGSRPLYQMPDGALFDWQYGNSIAEVIYEELCQKQLKKEPDFVSFSIPGGDCGDSGNDTNDNSSENGNDGNDNSGDSGNDSNDNCGDSGNDSNDNSGENGNDGNDNSDNGCMQDYHLSNISDHHGGIDIHLPVKLEEEQREMLQQRITASVENYHANDDRGDFPGGILQKAGFLDQPEMPWQRILHRFTDNILNGDDYSLARPAKRYLMQDIIVPGHYGENISSMVVSLDTSGSMTKEIIRKVAKEIRGMIPNTQDITLIVADYDIQQVIKFDELENILKTGAFRGGGGTSHICVFKYIEEHHLAPRVFIGLTDLYSVFPEKKPPFPVLWLVPEKYGTPPPWGKVIVVKKD